MATTAIVPGFSFLNRMLLYSSVLLAPAQFASGYGNNCPSNLGFLAYNMYNQIVWYRAVHAQQLGALCLVLPHLNIVYGISYIGGISSGNPFMGGLLGLGTAGTMVLNNISAWTSWKIDQPLGFGEYKFFFFGWRTLTVGWHKFFLLWNILDSIEAFVLAVAIVILCFLIPTMFKDDHEDTSPWKMWLITLAAIVPGAAIMTFFFWPLALWMELIVDRNHVDSPTDWVAVWLFVAQAGAMIIPPCSAWLCCARRR